MFGANLSVLVTGGCGFVGQHIVKLLHEKTNVDEIRILDIVPFGLGRMLDYNDVKRVTYVAGDLRNMLAVTTALEGIDYVIHAASLISIGNFPDEVSLEEINVKGTNNLLHACIEAGVKGLIYTSSIDAVARNHDMIDVDESVCYPTEFYYGSYSRTKAAAETLVTKANNTLLINGERFYTVNLRPPLTYGEGDKRWMPCIIDSTRASFGIFIRNGPASKKHELAYAGNVAWAHIVALKALADRRNLDGGAYFITDDTQEKNISNCAEMFLNELGYNATSYYLPYVVFLLLVVVVQMVFWLLSPIKKVRIMANTRVIRRHYLNWTFSRGKAQRHLGYHPLYDPEESKRNSLKYYKQFKRIKSE